MFPAGSALIAETRMVRRTWCGPGENTWTMAREAVASALGQGTVSADEIDLVVVSSCSTMPMVNYPDPDNPVMADLAPLVLAELGRDDAVGIDLKAGYCAGFLRGPSNYGFGMSKQLTRLLDPIEAHGPRMHVTRGDGDGRVNLMT